MDLKGAFKDTGKYLLGLDSRKSHKKKETVLPPINAASDSTPEVEYLLPTDEMSTLPPPPSPHTSEREHRTRSDMEIPKGGRTSAPTVLTYQTPNDSKIGVTELTGARARRLMSPVRLTDRFARHERERGMETPNSAIEEPEVLLRVSNGQGGYRYVDSAEREVRLDNHQATAADCEGESDEELVTLSQATTRTQPSFEGSENSFVRTCKNFNREFRGLMEEHRAFWRRTQENKENMDPLRPSRSPFTELQVPEDNNHTERDRNEFRQSSTHSTPSVTREHNSSANRISRYTCRSPLHIDYREEEGPITRPALSETLRYRHIDLHDRQLPEIIGESNMVHAKTVDQESECLPRRNIHTHCDRETQICYTPKRGNVQQREQHPRTKQRGYDSNYHQQDDDQERLELSQQRRMDSRHYNIQQHHSNKHDSNRKQEYVHRGEHKPKHVDNRHDFVHIPERYNRQLQNTCPQIEKGVHNSNTFMLDEGELDIKHKMTTCSDRCVQGHSVDHDKRMKHGYIYRGKENVDPHTRWYEPAHREYETRSKHTEMSHGYKDRQDRVLRPILQYDDEDTYEDKSDRMTRRSPTLIGQYRDGDTTQPLENSTVSNVNSPIVNISTRLPEIEKYTNSPNDSITFLEFMEEFNLQVVALSIHETTRLKILPLYLADGALITYKNMVKKYPYLKHNFEELTRQLSLEFSDNCGIASSVDLYSKQKQSDETIGKYYSSICSMANRIYPNLDSQARDQIILGAFISGLTPVYKRPLLNNPSIKISRDAFKIAQRIERTNHMIITEGGVSRTITESAVEKVNKVETVMRRDQEIESLRRRLEEIERREAKRAKQENQVDKWNWRSDKMQPVTIGDHRPYYDSPYRRRQRVWNKNDRNQQFWANNNQARNNHFNKWGRPTLDTRNQRTTLYRASDRYPEKCNRPFNRNYNWRNRERGPERMTNKQQWGQERNNFRQAMEYNRDQEDPVHTTYVKTICRECGSRGRQRYDARSIMQDREYNNNERLVQFVEEAKASPRRQHTEVDALNKLSKAMKQYVHVVNDSQEKLKEEEPATKKTRVVIPDGAQTRDRTSTVYTAGIQEDGAVEEPEDGDQPNNWNGKHEDIVKDLKLAMTSRQRLTTPDMTHPLIVYSKCRLTTIGGTITQSRKGRLHPIGYYSRKLSRSEQNWPICELEALALVSCLENWSSLTKQTIVQCFTDSMPAKAILMQSQQPTLRRAKLVSRLGEFDTVTITYIKTEQNQTADYPSQMNTSDEDTESKDQTEIMAPEMEGQSRQHRRHNIRRQPTSTMNTRWKDYYYSK